MKVARTALLAGSMALCLNLSAAADPVLVGPPPMVDGKPVRMAVVKKWGRLWYPAPVVGFYRGMEFSYDHASRTLYVDGQPSKMQALVVDHIVYVPIKPVATGGDMETNEAHEAARQQLYHSHPDQVGNPVLEAPGGSHPWAGDDQPVGAVIDLDPSGSTHVPAHMRPGAAPPQQPPEALPGRLPRPGEVPVVQPQREPVVQIPPSDGGVPHQVTTDGGQPSSHIERPEQEPKTMQPVPYAAPKHSGAPGVTPEQSLPSKVDFASSSAQNKVFEVSVAGGHLTRQPKDALFSLRLKQINRSPVAQANLGSFSVRCRDGSRVEPVRSRSYLPGKKLAPGEERQGELVFRLPETAQPSTLELEGALPLTVELKTSP